MPPNCTSYFMSFFAAVRFGDMREVRLWKTVSDTKSAICKKIFINEIHSIGDWLGHIIVLLIESW